MPGRRRARPLSDAESEHVFHNRGLAWAVARRFKGHGVAFDDLLSAAYMGLIRAVPPFDPEYATFGTYGTVTATNWVRREFARGGRMWIPDHARYARPTATPRVLAAAEAAFAVSFVPLESVADPPARSAGRGHDEQDLEEAIAALPRRLRFIVRARLAGRSLKSIGRELGLSGEWVRQAESVAIARLRKSLGGG
ncbi:unnamed protein product [uncultured bacterium]|nr:unnamed protein product [uncultured bacterium]